MPVYDMDKDFDEIVSKVDFVFCAVNMPKAEIKALEERYAKAEVPSLFFCASITLVCSGLTSGRIIGTSGV